MWQNLLVTFRGECLMRYFRLLFAVNKDDLTVLSRSGAEEIAHVWNVLAMSAEEEESGSWFEEINQEQERQGEDEERSAANTDIGVRELTEHDLQLRGDDDEQVTHQISDGIEISENRNENKGDISESKEESM